MAEQAPAKFAYMIPVLDGAVLEGDPLKPSLPTIYKIRVGDVAAFRRNNTTPGYYWAAIYSLTEVSGGIKEYPDRFIKRSR